MNSLPVAGLCLKGTSFKESDIETENPMWNLETPHVTHANLAEAGALSLCHIKDEGTSPAWLQEPACPWLQCIGRAAAPQRAESSSCWSPSHCLAFPMCGLTCTRMDEWVLRRMWWKGTIVTSTHLWHRAGRINVIYYLFRIPLSWLCNEGSSKLNTK